MARRRACISFKAEDLDLVRGLRLLARNPNCDLGFYDESARVPIHCLVNTDTHTSRWVAWELETAIELEKPIVAMAVKGVSKATLPGPIWDKGVEFYAWNTGSLGSYLNAAKTVR